MTPLHEVMKALDQLHIKENQLAWTQFTVGYDFGMAKAQEAVMAFLRDEANYQVVLDAAKAAVTPLERREAAIAKKIFDPYHKSGEISDLMKKIEDKVNDLMKVINAFRFKLDGNEVTSVALTQILMNEDDRDKRKAAFLSRSQINQPLFEAGFLDLVKMRKDLATLNGEDSFVAYKLKEDELDEAIFKDWPDQIRQVLPKVKKARQEIAKKYLNDDTIYPWDELYVTGRIAPKLNKQVDMSRFYDKLKAYFATYGFNLEDYGIVYDVFSRKNKSEWGYFFPIEAGVDARILANVKDRFYEYNVLMHETGHAVHYSLMKEEALILNQGISGIITEGIANLFGSMIYDETFYGEFFDEDLTSVKETFDIYLKWKNINAFKSVGLIMFDQDLYRKDLRTLEDIHDLYWSINKDLFDEAPLDFEPPWAYKIHHTSHPIYLHNYFMGDVTCEMLRSVYEKRKGKGLSEDPEEFGTFLYEEVMAPSGMYPYAELFRRISGKDFSLAYMLD